MTPASLTVAPALQVLDLKPPPGDVRSEVVAEMSRRPPHLPCKLLYDARGSRLFDEICQQPEYYPTRTEIGILRAHADAMATRIGPDRRLVELGSGSSLKTPILLEALHEPVDYVPIDISREHLISAARRTQRRFPELPVQPVVADYTHEVALPEAPRAAESTCVFFPGSTLGNFERQPAIDFLSLIAEWVGEDGALLIGVDLRKSPAVIEPAYNDAAGVTAEFNLNILAAVNHETGADFDQGAYRHRAVWDPARGRIEMRLICDTDQKVRVGDETFLLAAGDHIVTEYSHKRRLEEFDAMATEGGFVLDAVWRDERDYFAVCYLRVAD